MPERTLHYSMIGRQFTMRADLSQLSGRDKCALLNDLLRDLDLMDKIAELPGVNEAFKDAYERVWEK